MDVTFNIIARRLRTALESPLPGPDAQALMAPRPRREWPAGFDPAGVRHAAGLLLAFPAGAAPGTPGGEPHANVLLTVRADALGRHGGQVSLPGGVVDPGETLEQAALREAHEEVGLDPSRVQVIGPLTPIDIHVSGFRLHPIVALSLERPAMTPADSEVSRILELPVATLVDPGVIQWRQLTRDARTYDVPSFVVDEGHHVWGATAMVLAEFLHLLGWRGPGDETRAH
jgi:8-oxo-dGTP pyrophosphatase MutT (NUDIX family)